MDLICQEMNFLRYCSSIFLMSHSTPQSHSLHFILLLLLLEFAFNLIIYLSQRKLDVFQHVFLFFTSPRSSVQSNVKTTTAATSQQT